MLTPYYKCHGIQVGRKKRLIIKEEEENKFADTFLLFNSHY